MIEASKNMIWSILESSRDIQEWVTRMITQQRLDRVKDMRMKAERLKKARQLQDDLIRMDWTENVLEDMDMEWEEGEEHSALDKLMQELNIYVDIEDMELESNEEHDGFDEEIEHEFLDKILQELEDKETDWSSGLLLEDIKDTTIDECIQTYSCTVNCTSNYGDNMSSAVPPSTVDQGCGKTVGDNVQLSPEASECIMSVHCAGDCTCVQKDIPLSGPGETGYVVNNIVEQPSGINKPSTINSEYCSQFPTFMDWMMQFQRGVAVEDDQQHQEEGHHGGEGRALGGEVMGGEGGGDGRVERLVKVHESSLNTQNKYSRMKTPNRRRGVIRDGLVQTRLASFANLGGQENYLG